MMPAEPTASTRTCTGRGKRGGGAGGAHLMYIHRAGLCVLKEEREGVQGVRMVMDGVVWMGWVW